MNSRLLSAVTLLTVLSTPMVCSAKVDKPPYSSRVTFRHIEPNGIGYNQGYTSADLFFSPWQFCNWRPFLDLRAHFFDNGKKGCNTGLGFRYVTDSRVWGGNFFYDWRQAKHDGSYNQVALGLETLGRVWDFRINGYLPVGKKTSSVYDIKFDDFVGNTPFLTYKKQFTLAGFNAEASAHVNYWTDFPLCFSGGVYYLTGKGHSAWGGEARAEVGMYEYIQLVGNASYDHIYKWIGQGEFRFVIPLGRPSKSTADCCCYCDNLLAERSAQRVERHEIIPLDHKTSTADVIDPFTGLPYNIIFVNNTSHSDGTIESPYPTLLDAQINSKPNDIIAVFSGDGTTMGYDMGITLQNNQQFWGLGIPHTINTPFGPITIPALSATPNITNTGGNVVTLANNNNVSGFNMLLSSGNNGLYTATGITSLAADNLTMTEGGTGSNGISLTDMQGIITINDCIFNITGDYAINLTQSIAASSCNVSCVNNTYAPSPANDAQGIKLLVNSDASLGQLVVNGGTFTGNSAPVGQNGGGLDVTVNADATLNTLEIGGATFASGSASEGGAIAIDVAGTINNLSIAGSTFTSNLANSDGELGGAVYAILSGTLGTFKLSNNTFNGNTASQGGAVFVTTSGPITTFTSSGNTFTGNTASAGGGAYALVLSGAITVGTLSITGDTYTNNTTSADFGGAIGLIVGADSTIGTLSMTGANFSTNTAVSQGGAIYTIINGTLTNPMTITGGTFSGNTVSDGPGGAIYTEIADTATVSALTISGGTFTDNTAEGGNPTGSGGAIATYVDTGATLPTVTYENLTASGNTAQGSGGAIYTRLAGTIDNLFVTTGSYSSNTSAGSVGGAIAVGLTTAGSLTNMTVTDGIYTGNTNTGSSSAAGGAIGLVTTSTGTFDTILVSGGTYTSNSAPGQGGAIGTIVSNMGAVDSGTVTIENATFDSNNVTSATSNGGAISTYLTSTMTGTLEAVTVTGCTFMSNTAQSSGGALVTATTAGTIDTVTLTDNTFMENSTANGNGGALFNAIQAGEISTITIAGGSFTSNTATSTTTGLGNGGAICTSVTGTVDILSISGATFSGNSVTNDNGTDGNGGAIYTGIPTGGTLATMLVTGSTFSDNTADGVSPGGSGGAIYTTVTGTGALTNPGGFTSNTLTLSGTGTGTGIYLVNNSSTDVQWYTTDNTFTASDTWVEGGAIDVVQSSTSGTTCLFIQGNTATPATDDPFFLDNTSGMTNTTYDIGTGNTPDLTPSANTTEGSCPSSLQRNASPQVQPIIKTDKAADVRKGKK